MLETKFQFLMLILYSAVEQGQGVDFKGHIRRVQYSHPLQCQVPLSPAGPNELRIAHCLPKETVLTELHPTETRAAPNTL